MRFLADENFPGDAVAALRAEGNDVACVQTDAPGSADHEVLARAIREQRVVLTFDKDFGELAWRELRPAECGIVLFRIRMPAPSSVATIISSILNSRDDWSGNFAVIEPGRIRMRELPGTP